MHPGVAHEQEAPDKFKVKNGRAIKRAERPKAGWSGVLVLMQGRRKYGVAIVAHPALYCSTWSLFNAA